MRRQSPGDQISVELQRQCLRIGVFWRSQLK